MSARRRLGCLKDSWDEGAQWAVGWVAGWVARVRETMKAFDHVTSVT